MSKYTSKCDHEDSWSWDDYKKAYCCDGCGEPMLDYDKKEIPIEHKKWHSLGAGRFS